MTLIDDDPNVSFLLPSDPFHRMTDSAMQTKRNVTARLMGDPPPDRVVPEIPQPAVFARRRWDEPLLQSPIHLTFRESRAHWGQS